MDDRDEISLVILEESRLTGVPFGDFMEQILWLGWHCYIDNLANESEEP